MPWILTFCRYLSNKSLATCWNPRRTKDSVSAKGGHRCFVSSKFMSPAGLSCADPALFPWHQLDRLYLEYVRGPKLAQRADSIWQWSWATGMWWCPISMLEVEQEVQWRSSVGPFGWLVNVCSAFARARRDPCHPRIIQGIIMAIINGIFGGPTKMKKWRSGVKTNQTGTFCFVCSLGYQGCDP